MVAGTIGGRQCRQTNDCLDQLEKKQLRQEEEKWGCGISP
jgi:hypothetical protein